MSNRMLWFLIFLLGLGGLFLYTGSRLNMPIASSLGTAFIGSFVFAGGVHAIITKKLGYEPRDPNFGRRELYTGLAAQLWGILFIVFALVIFILAGVSLFYPGGAEAFWAVSLGKPWGWGILLIGIGLAAIVNGIIHFLAGSAGYYKGLPDLVERISGIVPLILGLGMTVIGLSLILVPDLLIGLFNQIITTIFR